MDLILLLAVLLSAWGSSTFSGELDRFGCKMIWMVPMLVMLAALAMSQERSKP